MKFAFSEDQLALRDAAIDVFAQHANATHLRTAWTNPTGRGQRRGHVALLQGTVDGVSSWLVVRQVPPLVHPVVVQWLSGECFLDLLQEEVGPS